ncbi:MAG: folate family ECF transporter S component [Clostridiales bacterium]|nr:folate family ECF transporter S component [Clostridiales bacterium]
MQTKELKEERKQMRTRVFAHPFSPSYWRCAAYQLKDVRILCIAAILVAVRVAMKSLAIPVGENLSITLGFFVNALGAMIFGPVVAVIGAAISDTLGCLLFPSGAYFFPFIFVEIAGSLIFALFLWRAKLSTTRIILSRFSVVFVCNLVMNPALMIWYYEWLNNGKTYKFITLPRVIKNLALFPAEAFLLVIFLGALTPALIKLKIIPQAQEKIEFTKKHLILLGVLLVLAIAFVCAYYFAYLPNK